MKDRELRKCIGISEYELNHVDEEHNNEEFVPYKTIEERLKRLERELLVNDFFYKCPCCGKGETILKSESVAFKKYYQDGSFGYPAHISTYYTTKEGAKNHSVIIKEWTDECKKHKNNKNLIND